jgi:hypothetical protein
MLDKILESGITRYSIVLVFIPLCLCAVLAPYSIFLGWNLITLFIFWFIIVPVMTIYLSSKFLKRYHRMWKSMLALISFYGFMIFMIYKHYESDYFMVMIASLVYNLLVMAVVIVVERADKRAQEIGL